MASASFLFPVVDGVLHVAKRMSPPHVGLYGPVGGKPEPAALHTGSPHYIEKLGGARVRSLADEDAVRLGHEYPSETAVREAWEELFVGRRCCADDITDVCRLGMIVDEAVPGFVFSNYMHIGRLHRADWNLSAREVADIRPVYSLDADHFFDIAKIALEEIRWRAAMSRSSPDFFPAYWSFDLDKQIPHFPFLPYRFTGMVGPYMHPTFLPR